MNSKKILLCCLFLLALFSFKQSVAVFVPSVWQFIPSELQNSTATFHLLFVTSASTTAEATQISYYNDFVIDAASRNTNLVDVNGNSFANEFRVLGSTSETNAYDNTNTNPASHSNGGYPIYFIGGHKVADNYSDFYDGGWDHPDDQPGSSVAEETPFNVYNEDAEIQTSSTDTISIFTGTLPDGRKASFPLNDIFAYLGETNTSIVTGGNKKGGEITLLLNVVHLHSLSTAYHRL